MEEMKPKPCPPAENSYLQSILELWYSEITSESTKDAPSKSEILETSQAPSSSDKPRQTLNMDLSTVYASLKVSHELALAYPAGFSLLLKRFFWEPQKLQNDLNNVSVGDIMEYIAIGRQSEVYRMLRNDQTFFSHFWASKSNLEILEGLFDSIAVRKIKLDCTNSKDLDIATICWARMKKPVELSIKAPLQQICLYNVRIFVYLMSKLAPTFSKRVPPQKLRLSMVDAQKSISCFRAPNSRSHISDGRSILLATLPTLLSKLPNDVYLKSMNASFSASSQLLSLAWPYFALFMKTRRESQVYSAPNPDTTETAIELDFGNRLPPGALKSLLHYFYHGTASFEPYEAIALLHYAEELRLWDGEQNPNPGFQGLMDHLRFMASFKKYHVPPDQAIYGLVFAAEAHNVEIWQKSVEALFFLFLETHPSHSIEWIHQSNVELLWLASWSLLSGTIQYPFTIEQS